MHVHVAQNLHASVVLLAVCQSACKCMVVLLAICPSLGGSLTSSLPKAGEAKAAAGSFSILDPSMQSHRCNQSWHFATGMKSCNSCLLKQVELSAPARAASDSQVNPLRAGLLSIATKLCLARPGPLVPRSQPAPPVNIATAVLGTEIVETVLGDSKPGFTVQQQ